MVILKKSSENYLCEGSKSGDGEGLDSRWIWMETVIGLNKEKAGRMAV